MTHLGVSKSQTGRAWRGPTPDILETADQLTSLAGIDPTLAKIYARLGATLSTLDQFRDPRLRDLLPDPSSLLDMDNAVARISKAIDSKENIAIFADYDVDGASSAALLIDYLRAFDIAPSLYIPDRLSEGYGPNIPAMEALAQDHSLIITVDCGTLSFEPIKAAVALGAEVIVLDHHMAGEQLPNAITVNPNRQDCDNALGHLCAAGVVFLVLVGLNRARKDTSPTPDLMAMLDLVALATVADVAPLIGVNRAFVRTGLEVMAARKRAGLRMLIDQHLSFQKLEAEHIGFVLGPRLNAGGRIGRSITATQLLTCQTDAEAGQIMAELEDLNSARRDIEAAITSEAIAQVESNMDRTEHFVYATGADWHPGVLGIVAARLKSHFGKPAVVLTQSEQELTGSARSIAGIDLGGAVARLSDEGLITKGGGHKMAAGLSLTAQKLEEAMARLDHLLTRQSNALIPALDYDAVIAPSAISISLIDSFHSAGPFGAMAAPPIFVLPDMRLQSRTILKDRHIKYRFHASGQNVDIMSFNSVAGPLDIGEAHPPEQRFHIAVTLKKNFWNGRETAQIFLEDIAMA